MNIKLSGNNYEYTSYLPTITAPDLHQRILLNLQQLDSFQLLE